VPFFSLELLTRFLVSPIQSNIITVSQYQIVDLISIVPFYLYLVLWWSPLMYTFANISRVFRILRLFQLFRFSDDFKVIMTTTRRCYKEVIIYFVYLSTGVLIFGSILFYVENGGDPDSTSIYDSIPESSYWAIITMTTV
jgi:hypothetical protein